MVVLDWLYNTYYWWLHARLDDVCPECKFLYYEYICTWRQVQNADTETPTLSHVPLHFYLIHAGIGAGAITVSSSVTVKFTCTAPDRPTWYLNGNFTVTNGTCYRSEIMAALHSNNTATLTITGNDDTCKMFNVYCEILIAPQFLYVHNTTLIFQG